MLIYGAAGYTGRLVVTEAMKRGLGVVVGGRGESVRQLAQSLGLEARIFEARTEQGVSSLSGCALVLNCAGPFSRTAGAIAGACLQTRTHYLDITGEVRVFEALAELDLAARTAGIVVLPGVGFDVVPTDCMALHLLQRLPTASKLTLAFSIEGAVSRGTLNSMVENLGEAGLERRGGMLTPVTAGGKTLTVDFGNGPVAAFQVAWGDLATAYRSTGIPNIEVYATPSPGWRLILRASAGFGGRTSSPIVQRALKSAIQLLPAGPSVEARARGRSFVWGRVENADGGVATARLQAPEAYTLTAVTAVAAAVRVLRGDVSPGFQTPAKAFGPDFILEVNGVSRIDL